LEHLGIDKTRASKARAIYRTFSKEEDVAGLTVEEAYAQRQRKRSATPPAPAAAAVESKKSIQSLRTSVGKIAQRTGAVVLPVDDLLVLYLSVDAQLVRQPLTGWLIGQQRLRRTATFLVRHVFGHYGSPIMDCVQAADNRYANPGKTG
jgi:3-methyladenine DNA glycosylase AlkC